jgi:hypothetical protein
MVMMIIVDGDDDILDDGDDTDGDDTDSDDIGDGNDYF